MAHVAGNTGMNKNNFSKGEALSKKQRIENLAKKVRKGKATKEEIEELESLKK